MLYYNTETMEVSIQSSGSYNEESFDTTMDFNIGDEGWILVCQYTTYDSFQTDDEISTAIIDIYPDKHAAREQANNLMHYENTRDEKYLPLYANGSQIKYLHFIGWGSSFKKCYIKKVNISLPDYEEFGQKW